MTRDFREMAEPGQFMNDGIAIDEQNFINLQAFDSFILHVGANRSTAALPGHSTPMSISLVRADANHQARSNTNKTVLLDFPQTKLF